MANTTFNGPVRSENGFQDITKNATTGAVTSTMTLQTYEATITVANGATTGKEAAIGMSGFSTGVSGLVGDEVELVVSADPGGDTVIVLKFFGISSSSDAS